jgi:hypothetical protein
MLYNDRPKWVFLANLKYFVTYVAVILFVCALVAFICWDPALWGLVTALIITLIIRYKIWG